MQTFLHKFLHQGGFSSNFSVQRQVSSPGNISLLQVALAAFIPALSLPKKILLRSCPLQIQDTEVQPSHKMPCQKPNTAPLGTVTFRPCFLLICCTLQPAMLRKQTQSEGSAAPSCPPEPTPVGAEPPSTLLPAKLKPSHLQNLKETQGLPNTHHSFPKNATSQEGTFAFTCHNHWPVPKPWQPPRESSCSWAARGGLALLSARLGPGL